MARKTQNVKKKKIDYLGSLKSITKWITNQNRKDDQLVEMIEKYNGISVLFGESIGTDRDILNEICFEIHPNIIDYKSEIH